MKSADIFVIESKYNEFVRVARETFKWLSVIFFMKKNDSLTLGG